MNIILCLNAHYINRIDNNLFKTITNSNRYFGSYCSHDKFIWMMTTEDMEL